MFSQKGLEDIAVFKQGHEVYWLLLKNIFVKFVLLWNNYGLCQIKRFSDFR